MLTRSYPRHFTFYVADPSAPLTFAIEFYLARAFEDEIKNQNKSSNAVRSEKQTMFPEKILFRKRER